MFEAKKFIEHILFIVILLDSLKSRAIKILVIDWLIKSFHSDPVAGSKNI